jgi:hypothetical protein
MVQMETAPNHTEWRALWMTESLVGFASITKDDERWTAYSDDDQAESVTSWARPIRDVKSVELGHVECKKVHGYGEREKDWWWSAGAQVRFGDGAHVDLPLFGTSLDHEHDVQIQSFLDAIANR